MANVTEMQDMAQRVATLERALRHGRRRARVTALAALSLAATVFVYEARTAAQSDARIKGPFEVLNSQGRVVFRVDDDGWLLLAANGVPLVGARIDDGKGTLQVGHAAMAGSFAQLTFSDDDKSLPRPKVELVTASRVVGEFIATKGGAKLTIPAPGVITRDSDKVILEVGQDDAEEGAFVKLGNVEGNTAVMLSAAKTGGRVRVFTAKGVAVGGLVAKPEGGAVALTGPAGGETAVGLSVSETGGSVKVFPAAGGTARAELSADGPGGSVTAYSQAGEAVAILKSGEGAGLLEISDGSGIVVQAGALRSGIGIVRTGPMGRMAAAGLPGSFIMGKKQ